jgi:tetratricopeptide (TPR) repeat protein
MPVKATKEDFIPNMGGVDPLTSYDILMNKCAWGNLKDPHVYMDPESLNNQARPKTNMLRTAQSLLGIGRTKEAVRLMDKYFEEFPDSRVSYDMYTMPFAEMYYKAGETAKATKILKRIGQIYSQNLDYYYTFKGKIREYYSKDIEQALGILRRMNYIARDNNQPQLATEFDALFQKELKKYQ